MNPPQKIGLQLRERWMSMQDSWRGRQTMRALSAEAPRFGARSGYDLLADEGFHRAIHADPELRMRFGELLGGMRLHVDRYDAPPPKPYPHDIELLLGGGARATLEPSALPEAKAYIQIVASYRSRHDSSLRPADRARLRNMPLEQRMVLGAAAQIATGPVQRDMIVNRYLLSPEGPQDLYRIGLEDLPLIRSAVDDWLRGHVELLRNPDYAGFGTHVVVQSWQMQLAQNLNAGWRGPIPREAGRLRMWLYTEAKNAVTADYLAIRMKLSLTPAMESVGVTEIEKYYPNAEYIWRAMPRRRLFTHPALGDSNLPYLHQLPGETAELYVLRSTLTHRSGQDAVANLCAVATKFSSAMGLMAASEVVLRYCCRQSGIELHVADVQLSKLRRQTLPMFPDHLRELAWAMFENRRNLSYRSMVGELDRKQRIILQARFRKGRDAFAQETPASA